MKKCPYCAEEIQDEAIVCKHCGRDLVPQTQASRPQVTQVQQAKSKIQLLPILILLIFIVCACGALYVFRSSGGGGGGGSTSSTDCIHVWIDEITEDMYGPNLYIIVRNKCDYAVCKAEIQTTCFSSSEQVVAQDTDYVENLAKGDMTRVIANIHASYDEMSYCKPEVARVTFK